MLFVNCTVLAVPVSKLEKRKKLELTNAHKACPDLTNIRLESPIYYLLMTKILKTINVCFCIGHFLYKRYLI